MDQLEAMATFRTVVEEGGFAKAARKRGISPASATRLVAELEHHLAMRLLHRTTRTLNPTDEGLVYYHRCTRILDDIADADRRMREAHDVPRGDLRVTTAPAFGVVALAPLLPSFCAAFPEVSVELHLDGRMMDLVRDGFDLALRFKATEWGDTTLRARHLRTFRSRFVASPAYLEARGVPERPADLERHTLIQEANPVLPDGLHFDGPEGPQTIRVRGPVRTESSLVHRHLVLSGMGIAEIPEYVVRDDLASGALVEVLPDHRLPHLELWAVFPPHSTLSARLRAFLDHVGDRL